MEHMHAATFAFIESAKGFFRHGKPLCELVPFLAHALYEVMPIDALGVVRLDGRGRVAEAACWSERAEDLLCAAFELAFPKEEPLPEREIVDLLPTGSAGTPLVLPIRYEEAPLGLLFLDKRPGTGSWTPAEQGDRKSVV